MAYGMGSHQMYGAGGQLNAEVGYGLPVGARFVGTPRVGGEGGRSTSGTTHYGGTEEANRCRLRQRVHAAPHPNRRRGHGIVVVGDGRRATNGNHRRRGRGRERQPAARRRG